MNRYESFKSTYDQGYQDMEFKNPIEIEFDHAASNSNATSQGLFPTTDKILLSDDTRSENIDLNQLILKTTKSVRKNKRIFVPYPNVSSYLKACPYCSEQLIWHALSTHIRDIHRDKWVIFRGMITSRDHYTKNLIIQDINITPTVAQKIVGQSSVVTTRAAVGGSVSFAGRQFTPQQFNALKQHALLRKHQQEALNAAAITEARLRLLQTAQLPPVRSVTLASSSGSQVVAATAPIIMGQAATSTGQKVSVVGASIGGVSLANVTNAVSTSGNIVVTSTMTGTATVVTQAMNTGQSNAHLIRQVNALGKGRVRTISDSELKLSVHKQQQLQQLKEFGQTQIRLPTHQTKLTGQTARTIQFLAQHGIQVYETPRGHSAAPLDKTSTAGTLNCGNLPRQRVSVPVAAGAMNLPQIRASLSRITNPQQTQMLQKQLLQRKQLQQGGITLEQMVCYKKSNFDHKPCKLQAN